LQDGNVLIAKWDTILHGLCHSITRRMARLHFEKDLVPQITAKQQQSLKKEIQKKSGMVSVYVERLRDLGVANGSQWFAHPLTTYLTGNGHKNIFSYFAEKGEGEKEGAEGQHRFVVKSSRAIEGSANSRARPKLYLFADGFSLYTLDNFHLFDDDRKFIDCIDQGLCPKEWICIRSFDHFHQSMMSEHNLRHKRAADGGHGEFRNGDDEYISPSSMDAIRSMLDQNGRTKPPFQDGRLWIDVMDFRYAADGAVNGDVRFERIPLCARNSMAMYQAFHDLPPLILENGRAISSLQKWWSKTAISKYRGLHSKYSFYAQFKRSMAAKFESLAKEYNAKCHEVNQLQTIYTQYLKQHHSIMPEMQDNFSRHSALKSKLEERLLSSHYELYDPTNPAQAKYIEQRCELLRKRMLFENVAAGNEQRMSQRKQGEKQRFYKATRVPTVRHEIEREILLKLHPDLSLQPSLEVMQVMNYVHYVRSQSLVRPLFGHKALAKKMKSYRDGNGRDECRHRNVIMHGIAESQKFLDFVRENGNEQLFRKLESIRNETPFLHDVGKEEEKKRLNKHPGQYCRLQYAPTHFDTKCCILRKYSPSGCAGKYKLTVLKIDFLNHHKEGTMAPWLRANGSWLFSVTEIEDFAPTAANVDVDWAFYLNSRREHDRVIHSDEYLTLNTAARGFYHYLQLLYDKETEMVFSQNTKFDEMRSHAHTNNNDCNDFYDLL